MSLQRSVLQWSDSTLIQFVKAKIQDLSGSSGTSRTSLNALTNRTIGSCGECGTFQ